MRRATLAVGLVCVFVACAGDDAPQHEEPAPPSDPQLAQSWISDLFGGGGLLGGGFLGGGAGGGGGTGGGGSTCVASLKSRCRYDEIETACSSLTTPSIPLTNGSTWGNSELALGPYGAYVEWNEGANFANPISSYEDFCGFAIALFGEPESVNQDVADLRGQNLGLYTVFRPACMKEGETYPVITWGNGTCGQAGGYASLLAAVASHGFVVVAANSRWTGQGNNEMLRALDFAKAANEDPSSVYYHKLDMSKVGAMGHSQGAAATATAANDPRIKAVILWNGGISASKPFLAVSGDADVTNYTPQSMAAATALESQPNAWLYYHNPLQTGGWVTGHLVLMEQPDRVASAAIAWWKYMLKGDSQARATFVGSNCGLCNRASDFEYGANRLP